MITRTPIKRKKCKCGCQRFPSLGYAGYSSVCAPEEIKEKVGSKRQVAQRNKNARLAAVRKIRKEENKKDNALEFWFRSKMATSKKICENCGMNLSGLNYWEWRGSQHHLIEKHHCSSVATHPLNHGVLGYYCCHGQWHTSYMNAQKMPFFNTAFERVKLFIGEVDESEIKFIPDCFKILLETLK